MKWSRGGTEFPVTMGLTKTETLMKYVHTNKEVISEVIDKMIEIPYRYMTITQSRLVLEREKFVQALYKQ